MSPNIAELYWTLRFAPYLLAVTGPALALSVLWVTPQARHLGIAALSGVMVFIFHSLRWRTGRNLFQMAALVVAVGPFLSLLHRDNAVDMFMQYTAAFAVADNLLVMAFGRQILTGLLQARKNASGDCEMIILEDRLRE